MGVPLNSLPLVIAYLTYALVGHSWCREEACLQDGRAKATPSPEPYLKECALYAENACCSANDIQDVVGPAPGAQNSPWDKCGSLTPNCEAFLKRVTCFYHCSPDAARWLHPQRASALQAVPLCHSFCLDWYEACRTDLTRPRDWAMDPRGLNSTGSCVPYQQLYQHGRDLCERLWGDAFAAVEDEEGGERGEEGRPCGCLTLSPTDKDVIAALRAQDEDPDELDTTKTGLPQYRAPCRPGATLPPQARRSVDNGVIRKRSLLPDDGEGSGSGF